MKLSIIIPVKNRAHIIEQTINSILSTNYPDLEIIIIDNNSEDQTEKIIRNYENIIYVKNIKDKESLFKKYGYKTCNRKIYHFFRF